MRELGFGNSDVSDEFWSLCRRVFSILTFFCTFFPPSVLLLPKNHILCLGGWLLYTGALNAQCSVFRIIQRPFLSTSTFQQQYEFVLRVPTVSWQIECLNSMSAPRWIYHKCIALPLRITCICCTDHKCLFFFLGNTAATAEFLSVLPAKIHKKDVDIMSLCCGTVAVQWKRERVAWEGFCFVAFY